jgi:hypothetical protein
MTDAKRFAIAAFATCVFHAPAVRADDVDLDAPLDETPEQREERIANMQGKFNAGVSLRFPSGPDDMGEYATFNWVALDLRGRYNVTDIISVHGNIPLAIIKPDLPDPLPDPSIFGGITGRGEIKLGGTIGAGVTVGFLRYGAFLLSDKDYPLYAGDLNFGMSLGPWLKLKTGVVNLAFVPAFVYQAGDPESITGIQVPVSAMIRAGNALKLSADVGLYSGDDFSLGADEGGRVGIGTALDIKVSKIMLHLGVGLASLLTDDAGFYPSVGKSLYFDLNVKYAP